MLRKSKSFLIRVSSGSRGIKHVHSQGCVLHFKVTNYKASHLCFIFGAVALLSSQ